MIRCICRTGEQQFLEGGNELVARWQEDEGSRKTTHRRRGHHHAGDPAAGDEGGKRSGARRQPTDIVEEQPKRLAERARRAR